MLVPEICRAREHRAILLRSRATRTCRVGLGDGRRVSYLLADAYLREWSRAVAPNGIWTQPIRGLPSARQSIGYNAQELARSR
jgi:hypothetical protein